MYTAAAAVDRRLGSRMLVQALARVPNARRYLPQAVRLDAALAPLILNLHRQGP